MGHTCSPKTKNIICNQLSKNHDEYLNQFFHKAIQNRWVLVLIIDDFNKIHTNRRPSQISVNAISMCTIVMKAFKQLKAIEVPSNIFNIHYSDGLNVQVCLESITSDQQMIQLSDSYVSIMPDWLTTLFFTLELERHILEEHGYSDELEVRLMRTMEDLYLTDFVELQLKSKDGFSKAYKVALSSGLAAYSQKFIVIQPGDWPCQFYCRQLVYECLAQHQKFMLSSECPTEIGNHRIQQIPAMVSLVPTIGPLHISLNSSEDIFKTLQPFFQQVYTYMFPKSKLAASPKP